MILIEILSICVRLIAGQHPLIRTHRTHQLFLIEHTSFFFIVRRESASARTYNWNPDMCITRVMRPTHQFEHHIYIDKVSHALRLRTLLCVGSFKNMIEYCIASRRRADPIYKENQSRPANSQILRSCAREKNFQ